VIGVDVCTAYHSPAQDERSNGDPP